MLLARVGRRRRERKDLRLFACRLCLVSASRCILLVLFNVTLIILNTYGTLSTAFFAFVDVSDECYVPQKDGNDCLLDMECLLVRRCSSKTLCPVFNRIIHLAINHSLPLGVLSDRSGPRSCARRNAAARMPARYSHSSSSISVLFCLYCCSGFSTLTEYIIATWDFVRSALFEHGHNASGSYYNVTRGYTLVDETRCNATGGIDLAYPHSASKRSSRLLCYLFVCLLFFKIKPFFDFDVRAVRQTATSRLSATANGETKIL
jgi:hypothetical protein